MQGETIKGECPNCGGERNAFVEGKHTTSWKDKVYPIDGSNTGYLLRCCGCDTIYFREDIYFSENGFYYQDPVTGEGRYDPEIEVRYYPPVSKRPRPEWLNAVALQDAQLGYILNQIYQALDADLDILAAIGIRTSFDRASELMRINPELSFAKKLNALQEEGRIGPTEQEIMSVLIDAGSAAAHRGWRPETDDLLTMMTIMEQFIERNLITRGTISKLKEKIPKRT